MTATTNPASAEHLRTGQRGEALARRYLVEDKNLEILDANWRCPEGELDLVCTDGRQLIICEVKTRTSTRYGTPGEAVDHAKSNRIRRLTRAWLKQFDIKYAQTRYDIVAILWPPGETPQITHLEGVL